MKPPIDPDVLQAREAIENARKTLQSVRHGKLPKIDAKITHDLLGPGVERARAYAALPDLAPWRQEFERFARDMEAMRAAVVRLCEKRRDRR